MKRSIYVFLISLVFSCSLFSMDIYKTSEANSPGGVYKLRTFSDDSLEIIDNNRDEVILQKKFEDQITNIIVTAERDIRIELANKTMVCFHIKKPELHAIICAGQVRIIDESKIECNRGVIFTREYELNIIDVCFIETSIVQIIFADGSSRFFDWNARDVTCLLDANKRTLTIESAGLVEFKCSFKKNVVKCFVIGYNKFLYVEFADGEKKFFQLRTEKVELEDEDSDEEESVYMSDEITFFSKLEYDDVIFSCDRGKVCFINKTYENKTCIFEFTRKGAKKVLAIPGLCRSGSFCKDGKLFYAIHNNVAKIYDLENIECDFFERVQANKTFPFLIGEWPQKGLHFLGKENGKHYDYVIAEYSPIRYKILNKEHEELINLYSNCIRGLFIRADLHYCVVIYSGKRDNVNNILEFYSLNQDKNLCKKLKVLTQDSQQEFIWHEISDNGRYLFVQLSNNKFIVYDIYDGFKEVCHSLFGDRVVKATFKENTFNIKLEKNGNLQLLLPVQEGEQFQLINPDVFSGSSNRETPILIQSDQVANITNLLMLQDQGANSKQNAREEVLYNYSNYIGRVRNRETSDRRINFNRRDTGRNNYQRSVGDENRHDDRNNRYDNRDSYNNYDDDYDYDDRNDRNSCRNDTRDNNRGGSGSGYDSDQRGYRR